MNYLIQSSQLPFDIACIIIPISQEGKLEPESLS